MGRHKKRTHTPRRSTIIRRAIKKRKRDHPDEKPKKLSEYNYSRRAYLYCLFNIITGFFYVGITYDVLKRLRQHNGIIKGGAKKTKYQRPLQLLMYVTAPNTWLSWEAIARFEFLVPFLVRRLYKKTKTTLKQKQYMIDDKRSFTISKCAKKYRNVIKHINGMLWTFQRYVWLFHREKDWVAEHPNLKEKPHLFIPDDKKKLKWKLHPMLDSIIDYSLLKKWCKNKDENLWPIHTVNHFSDTKVEKIKEIMSEAVILKRKKRKAQT